MSELAERLGYGPEDRLLIVNCDDLGACHSANLGVYDALRAGVATSASLMVPCPWARHAAAGYRGDDIGVHLTLNSEYDRYRWGPITHAPSPAAATPFGKKSPSSCHTFSAHSAASVSPSTRVT